MTSETVQTRYGKFCRTSKRRIDLAYDCEEAEIEAFPRMAGHNGLADTSFVGDRMEHAVVEMKACPIDKLLPDPGRSAAIRIDVEGHEPEVLDGARQVLSSTRGFLQIEIMSEANMRAVTERLTALGYRGCGDIKSDYYFLHQSLADEAEVFRQIMFEEVGASLVELMELRRMRRSVLRTARRVGEAGDPIAEVARFKRDPMLAKKRSR